MMYYSGNNYFLSFSSLVCLVISVVMLCAPLNLIAIVMGFHFDLFKHLYAVYCVVFLCQPIFYAWQSLIFVIFGHQKATLKKK